MCAQGVFRHQLLGNLPRKVLIDPTLDVDFGELMALEYSILAQLLALARKIRRSDCELTDTYSPAAIDMAPATNPATPAIKTSFRVAAAAATPTIKLAVDRMPSLAPSTAALNHPMRMTKWLSGSGRIRCSCSGLKPPHEKQNDDDDQDDADDADAAVTETVTVAAEPAAEAAEQEDDEDDDKNQSE
jgi:hypothetical protein